MMGMKDFPVDMVYLWCDGNDAEFQRRKEYYLRSARVLTDNGCAGDQRFADNEELRYSLRSLEYFAPWVNHVYIVTDRQTPKWLNLANPKVTIVDHSEIMPKELIPCFNSTVIERYLPFIPNLSEHFLYGNDDTFFYRALTKDYFFRQGKPIVRMNYNDKYKEIKSEQEYHKHCLTQDIFQRMCLNSWKLLHDRYHQTEFLKLHHNIDAYMKTAFLATLNTYAAQFVKSQSRFRSEDDIQRLIINMDAVHSGKAELQIVNRPSHLMKRLWWLTKVDYDSYCGTENKKTRREIRRFKPALFCINADGKSGVADKQKSREFLKSLFPTPSAYEI